MNDNWLQHKNLLEKYIQSLSHNPYIYELKNDYDELKKHRFLRHFINPHISWLNEIIQDQIITKPQITTVNKLFDNKTLLNIFTDYIHTNCKTKKDIIKLFTKKDFNIDTLYNSLKVNIPEIEFNPTKLKFVTTTAIAWIVDPSDDVIIDFKKIYNAIEISDNILLVKEAPIYRDSYIGEIVGCKTGGEKVKGFFKKKNLGDFYNCTTVNVLLSQIKSVNVKIFNNGKLQMTGISKPVDGEKAVEYICNILNSLKSNKIITNKENYTLKKFSYKTVMINTCYELGICINRETLYNILSNRYNLNTIYDADGYPGVRVEYYYNTLTSNTEFEGLCKCSEKCRGKGIGVGEGNCRKISIAIFQSGSAIIAGGCNSIEPIYQTYNFINNLIKNIIGEIKKNESKASKLKKIRATTVHLEKKIIINMEYLDKLIKV